MSRKVRIPRTTDEAFKRKVIEEYLATGMPKERVALKYGIKGNSAILIWMRALGYEDVHRKQLIKFALPIPSTMPMAKKDQDDVRQLQKRIKELERQLEDEKLRSEAYSRIIDIAENQFKIPIKKKPDTK